MRGLPTGCAIAIGCALAWASSAGAVTITYSGIQEELRTSASARAGPLGGSAGVSDSKSDSGATTPYSNSLDSTVLDVDQNGSSAIASSGSQLIVDLLPTSDLLNPYAINADAYTGTSAQVFQGGRADTSTSANLTFLFEVDEVVRFSLYMFVDYEDGYAEVNLYNPDGTLLIGVDLDPTGTHGTGSGSVGLSGLLTPGGQYRLEARAGAGISCIGTGGASCTDSSGANFHFELATLAIPVPAPSSAGLLLAAGLALAGLRTRKGRRDSNAMRG